MSRKKVNKNAYKEVVKDGEICIEFTTGGKHEVTVTVDKKAWNEYICNFHWTAQKSKAGYLTVVTSIGGIPVRLSKMVMEREFLEIDYWGNTIDHKNNNTLDNRRSNLRIINNQLNPTNQKSKYETDNMHLIHRQKGGAYKIDTNTNGKKLYKNFQTKEEAIAYRDQVVIPSREAENIKIEKKARDIEFERGLRDKLNNNEKEEVLEILKKYEIIE